MGQSENKDISAYRDERIISAEYMRRPKEKTIDFTGHDGVYVHTDKGHDYLIHSTPFSGTALVDEPLSRMWSKSRDISVKGIKTVGEVFDQANGKTNNKMINYCTGGTCKGVAYNAEKALSE